MPTAPKRQSWKRASRSVSVSGSARSPKIMRQRPCRPPASKTLLWIDDYEPGLALYKAVFEGFGFKVLTASGGRKGLDLAASHDFDAVVVDYEMPVMNGEAVAKLIKTKWPELPVILFSGSSLLPGRVKHVVDAVCDKAGSRDALLSAIQRVLATKDHQRPPIPVVTSGQQQLA